MAAQEREKLPIPSMSVEEAVGLISTFGNKMALTEEDIKRPQYLNLRKWYLNSILVDQLGIAQERLLQPHFSSMTALEHPELHEESCSLLLFTLTLQRFMYACGVEDFTINDLISPSTYSKLSEYCIAVLNFVKFKNFQQEPYDKILEELDSLGERRHQALEQNAALRQRIDKLRVQRAEEEAQAEQIIPAVETLEDTIRELNREQAAEGKKYQQLKTTNAEQATKKADIKVSLAGQREHCENLKSKIVQSPDRFKAEISRLSKQLDTVKNSIDEKSRRFTELDNQKDGRLKCTENMKNALKLMKSICTDMERESELLGQREERQDKCRAQKEALKDLVLKIQIEDKENQSNQDTATLRESYGKLLEQ
ncbi:hypothetical protein QZH41_013328, partial [Actinostola sp. cb2023]